LYRESIRALAEHYAAAVVVEPESRNTALAVAYVLADEKIADQTILLFVPSDHCIERSDEYRAVVEEAARYAEARNVPILCGVPPTSASSLYGYIRYESALHEPFVVHSFIEKPHPEMAHALCLQGNVLWNCGMLAVSAGALRALYHTHAPEYYQAATNARAGDFHLWYAVPPEPFDRVVLERAAQLLVMPLSCGWADAGSLEQFIAYTGGHYSLEGKRVITDSDDTVVIDMHDSIIVTSRATLHATVARAREIILNT
jgi:mannose-1-phosphate guanylyltransferase